MGGSHHPHMQAHNNQQNHHRSMEEYRPSQPACNSALVQISRFFDLPTYAPHLVSYKWLDRPTRQSSLFLGSTITLAVIAQKLSPWLCTTQQGLWPQQLPFVEQAVCLRWLLSSAPEDNLEELWRMPQGFKWHYITTA